MPLKGTHLGYIYNKSYCENPSVDFYAKRGVCPGHSGTHPLGAWTIPNVGTLGDGIKKIPVDGFLMRRLMGWTWTSPYEIGDPSPWIWNIFANGSSIYIHIYIYHISKVFWIRRGFHQFWSLNHLWRTLVHDLLTNSWVQRFNSFQASLGTWKDVVRVLVQLLVGAKAWVRMGEGGMLNMFDTHFCMSLGRQKEPSNLYFRDL